MAGAWSSRSRGMPFNNAVSLLIHFVSLNPAAASSGIISLIIVIVSARVLVLMSRSSKYILLSIAAIVAGEAWVILSRAALRMQNVVVNELLFTPDVHRKLPSCHVAINMSVFQPENTE